MRYHRSRPNRFISFFNCADSSSHKNLLFSLYRFPLFSHHNCIAHVPCGAGIPWLLKRGLVKNLPQAWIVRCPEGGMETMVTNPGPREDPSIPVHRQGYKEPKKGGGPMALFFCGFFLQKKWQERGGAPTSPGFKGSPTPPSPSPRPRFPVHHRALSHVGGCALLIFGVRLRAIRGMPEILRQGPFKN